MIVRSAPWNQSIEGGKTTIISKEQFLTIKRMKADGVAVAAIAGKVGVSEPVVRKWARMDEAGFDALKRNDIPYMDQYREFIISILRICPQTGETNILYRLKEEFPEFECNRKTFYKYMKKLREQTGFLQFAGRVTSVREESPPGYEAQVDFGQYRMKDMYGKQMRVYFFCMVLSYSMIMKQLVEQIIVTDDGIEVHFKCGIVAIREYL